MNVFFISGDLGDAVAALPVIRHLGGGELVLGPHVGSGGPREPMTEARAEFLMPLIAAQPYIKGVTYSEKSGRITHDLSMFRATVRCQRNELLTHWQARHCGIKNLHKIDLSPWLQVSPSVETSGKVVMARSLRYHNPHFRWLAMFKQCGGQAVFVGLPSEHGELIKLTGLMPHQQVVDALEMARLIAGSKLFIGNQSLPCWLAMGLGHPLIQESCASCLNSKIVRHNARYVTGGI